MKPQSVSEQMMYTTIRIETRTGCGTGSYFDYQFGNMTVPVIITNKHVVNNNQTESVILYLHTKDENGNPSGNLKIQYSTNWVFHKDKDLCF